MTEYATFNDPPEEPKKKGWFQRLRDADKKRGEKAVAWVEAHEKEIETVATAVGGAIAGVLAYMATHSGGSPSRSSGWEGLNEYQMPVLDARGTPTGPPGPMFIPVHLTHLDHLGRVQPGWSPTGGPW